MALINDTMLSLLCPFVDMVKGMVDNAKDKIIMAVKNLFFIYVIILY